LDEGDCDCYHKYIGMIEVERVDVVVVAAAVNVDGGVHI
jgi:hypothetical protein